MNAQQLIQKLQQYKPETHIVIDGACGYSDINSIRLIDIGETAFKNDWEETTRFLSPYQEEGFHTKTPLQKALYLSNTVRR